MQVSSTVESILANHMDGVNFDMEVPVDGPATAFAQGYTRLVAMTTEELHAAVPGSQVCGDGHGHACVLQ